MNPSLGAMNRLGLQQRETNRISYGMTFSSKIVMFLLGISENKATRKEFAIYRSNVVVPTGPGFFSLKTFCFAKMTSRVFNIVLEGSFQRSCYEPGSTMLKKRDVIEAKLKV